MKAGLYWKPAHVGLGFRTVFPIHAMLHGLNMQPKHAVWQGVPC